MINAKQLAELKKWFSGYIRSFQEQEGDQQKQENIRLKIRHTARVRLHILAMADSLGLPPDSRRLCESIALLHDIGRFPQIKIYGSFDDRKSGNHAELGLQVIAEQGCLNSVAPGVRLLLEKTVLNHNLRLLPDEAEEVLFYSRLIRDADKLDIFRLIMRNYEAGEGNGNPAIDIGLPDTPGYRQRYIEDILHNRMCDRIHIRNINDIKLLRLSWLFDLNFCYAFSDIRRIGYLERMFATLPDTGEIRLIRQHLTHYLAERIGSCA